MLTVEFSQADALTLLRVKIKTGPASSLPGRHTRDREFGAYCNVA